MKKIIIVGHQSSNYKDVESLLYRHGMAVALPTQRDNLTPIEISASLRKLNKKDEQGKKDIQKKNKLNKSTLIAHKSKGVDKHYSFATKKNSPSQNLQSIQSNQIAVNPLWNGLAMDLMLSNLEQDFWGWADPQAINLLNYWKDVDPAIHFVFVYDKPQNILLDTTNLEQAELDKQSLEEMLSSWAKYNQDLLHFYQRNKKRCILVNGQQVITSSEDALKQVKNRIKAPWKESLDIAVLDGSHVDVIDIEEKQETQFGSPLSNYIADSLLNQYPAIQSTYEELQRAANVPLFSEQTEQGETEQAINAWNDLVKQQALLMSQKQLSEKLTANLVEVEKLAEERYFLFSQETQKAQASEQKLNVLTSEVESQKKTLLNLENEQKQTLQQKNEAVKNSQDYQQKLKNLENSTKEIENENDQLLSQLHQVQLELEKYYLENKALKAKPPLYGAANRVRQQLTYRIGQTLIENGRSVWGCLTMPCALIKVSCQFRKERKAKKWNKLPPIDQYQDAYEAEKIKKHLSYQLGKVFLNNIKTPWGWFKMPFAISKTTKIFKQSR